MRDIAMISADTPRTSGWLRLVIVSSFAARRIME
jgi:hypothetical protein